MQNLFIQNKPISFSSMTIWESELTKGQKIALAGGILAMFGFFLPWFRVEAYRYVQHVSGAQMGGPLLLILACVLLLIVFSLHMMGKLTMLFSVTGIVQIIWTSYQLLYTPQIPVISQGYSQYDTPIRYNISLEIGVIITTIGFLMGFYGGYIIRKEYLNYEKKPIGNLDNYTKTLKNLNTDDDTDKEDD